jgi:hypothetical protein
MGCSVRSLEQQEMAYSCSDFVDDVLNNLVILGLIKTDDIPDDNPEGQATLAIESVIRASAGAASAKAFFVELLDSVETLSAVSDEHGPSTLAQLMYLLTAILNGTEIELYANEAEKLVFVRMLPSGERWWKHVSQLPTNG